MTAIDPQFTDSLGDFEKRQVTLLGKTKTVYVAGSGPAVKMPRRICFRSGLVMPR